MIKIKNLYSDKLMQNPDDWVDMGLPSGTLWCTKNIDITQPNGLAASPFQYECSFFSWGNVDGHNPNAQNRFDYNFNEQMYGNTLGSKLTASFTADSGRDAAHENLGAPWRMPTTAEFAELFANIEYITPDGELVSETTSVAKTAADKRVTVNGIVGLLLRSKINGNTLFFPCSGFGSGYSIVYYSSYSCYWASSYTSDRDAKHLYIHPNGVNCAYSNIRSRGCIIRPVATKNVEHIDLLKRFIGDTAIRRVYQGENLIWENEDYYGIRWAESSGIPSGHTQVERIGKAEYHKTLPIQSKMRRCMLKDDGTVYKYISDTDPFKYEDGTTAKYDGSDGQVMVEIPDYWFDAYLKTENGITWNYLKLWPEPYKFGKRAGKYYMGAFEACNDEGSGKTVNNAKLYSISSMTGKTGYWIQKKEIGLVPNKGRNTTLYNMDHALDRESQTWLPVFDVKDGFLYPVVDGAAADDYIYVNYSVNQDGSPDKQFMDNGNLINCISLDDVINAEGTIGTSVHSRMILFNEDANNYRNTRQSSSTTATVSIYGDNNPIGRPSSGSGLSRATFRTQARNRGTNWSQQSWDAYCSVVRLYLVEHAKLDTQAAFEEKRNSDGYVQGGLSAGYTNNPSGKNGATLSDNLDWRNYYGEVPCGVTIPLGNNTGIINYYTDFKSTTAYACVPSYRGIENPFGHIWKFIDGINRRGAVNGDGTTVEEIFVCHDVAKFTESDNNNTTTIYDGAKCTVTKAPDGYELVNATAPRPSGGFGGVDWNINGTFWPKPGGSTVGYSDYFYNAFANGTWYTLYGSGRSANGANAGWFCLGAYYGSGDSYASFGSRLLYTPNN